MLVSKGLYHLTTYVPRKVKNQGHQDKWEPLYAAQSTVVLERIVEKQWLPQKQHEEGRKEK